MTGIQMIRMTTGWLPLSSSNTPSTMGGTLGNGVAYSENCTANPVGGSGSRSYSWTFTSNNIGFTISNPTAQTCSVQHSGVSDVNRTFDVQCQVTDTITGATAFSSSSGSVTWGTPP